MTKNTNRVNCVWIVAVALLGLFTQAAAAEDRDLGKISANEVKSSCDESGGKYWATPDGNNYGCAKNCPGGTCGIMCDKDTGCLGTTPKGRKRVPADKRNLMDSLMYSPKKQAPPAAR